MTWNLSLLLGLLAPAQPAEQVVTPRLERGQELVYRGGFRDDPESPRDLAFETRIFVIERDATGYELAVLTLLRPTEQGPPRVGFATVRLYLQGKMHPAPLAPIEGPPIVETGMFVPLPNEPLTFEQTWDAAEPGRAPRLWKVGRSEIVKGTLCSRFDGIQQSEEWGHSKVERGAWCRTDVVWLSPINGYASRVERSIEVRDPTATKANVVGKLAYALEGKVAYPGQIAEERCIEIAAAQRFERKWNALLPQAGRLGPKPFEQLSAEIAQFLRTAQPTPFREAIVAVQRKADAASKGHTPPALAREPLFTPDTLEVGEPAPEFVSDNLLTGELTRLSKWRGKIAVVLYFNAEAASAEPTLRFLDSLGEKWGERVGLLAVAMKGDAARVRQLRDRTGVRATIVGGDGPRKTQRVDSTPTFVVLDAEGVVRATSEGWGGETGPLILRAVDRYMGR